MPLAIGLRNPDALVSTDWLEAHLNDANLRIFDCSTVLEFDPDGDKPYRVVSCWDEHQAGHIPGAGYLDLQGDFSDSDSAFGMTLPQPDVVKAAFENAGVGNDTRVVLYSRRSMSWATRFWWMLHWLGFDNAAVLDGGFEKWRAEARPLSTVSAPYPSGHLTVALRSHSFADRSEIVSVLGDPSVCLVNALGRDVFSGENPRYGRPGRIPGSVNVPKVSLVNPETHAFLPTDRISEILSSAGVEGARRHVTYCVGGIFATVVAFWLWQLGQDNVAVYDNSMSEWGPDETLPIEAG